MKERMVYLNGSLVPESQATISVFDRGVQYGDAVYDAARTFGGQPFKLREHIDRLYRSCSYTRMPLRMTADEMEKQTREVLEHNLPLSGPDGEAMIWWSVTRGVSSVARLIGESQEATVIIYTFPVPFKAFAKWVTRGARVVTSATRRTPAQCLDPRAKVSNRMNHILADLEAKAADPEAYSLMLDLNGNVAEFATANLFIAKGGVAHTPAPNGCFLNGITRQRVIRLLRQAGIEVVERRVTFAEVLDADEVFSTGNFAKVLPCIKVEGRNYQPGPVYRKAHELYFKFAEGQRL